MTIVTTSVSYDQREEAALADFLRALALGRPLPPAGRFQDKARQRSRRHGWAYFDRCSHNSRWHITDRGRDYLKLIEGERAG